MIQYYTIAAVLLIYSNSTDADESFNRDDKVFTKNLRNEAKAMARPGKQEGILCDELRDEEKELICHKIMHHLVYKNFPGRFLPEERVSHPSSTETDGSESRYKCEDRFIQDFKMSKRMYWCEDVHFHSRQSSGLATLPGFYCAGSRIDPGRVYVFRPLTDNRPDILYPVGELDDVYILRQRAGVE